MTSNADMTLHDKECEMYSAACGCESRTRLSNALAASERERVYIQCKLAETEEMFTIECSRTADFERKLAETEALAMKYSEYEDAAEAALAQAVAQFAPALSDEEISQAVARGWCSNENSHKEMDTILAEAISREVSEALRRSHGKPD